MRGRAAPLAPAMWLWIATAGISLHAAQAPRPYTVEQYDVNLRADPAGQRLSGEARIRLRGIADLPVSALEFDSAGLEITDVLEGQTKQSFEQNRNGLFVALTGPLHADEQRTLTVLYTAIPGAGLKFFPDQIIASDVTNWMPCNNTARDRSLLHLTIAAPADWKTAASGRLISTRAESDQTITGWQSRTPVDVSRFGFVLGKLAESDSEAGGIALRELGVEAGAPQPLGAAFTFFAERTGRPYPGTEYTEAFTRDSEVHSFDGLTLLPGTSEKDLRLRAEELAKQWFGVAIAPKNGAEIWLTEGLSVFLADSFSGQQSGKGEFEEEMERTKRAYDQLRSEGRDLPLADAAGRDLARTKGVWFLFLVNQLIGDERFWQGVKLYTGSAWGQPATSEDLQKAFDAANAGNAPATAKNAARRNNPKEMDKLFDVWVFGVSDAKEKSKTK